METEAEAAPSKLKAKYVPLKPKAAAPSTPNKKIIRVTPMMM
ncbi:hypothetical protein N9L68_04835 [bacterium]|nr:hypothetical protein [bacterium]